MPGVTNLLNQPLLHLHPQSLKVCLLLLNLTKKNILLTFETDTPPPTQQFGNLSVSEPSTNPWQPALNEKTSQPPSIHHKDSGSAAWSGPPPVRQAPAVPAAPLIDASQPALVDLEEPESPAWDQDEPSPIIHEMPAESAPEVQQMNEDSHAWDEHQGHDKQNAPATGHFLAVEDPQQGEGWNIVDHEAEHSGQHSGVISGDGTILERFPTEEDPPALPPRRSQEHPTPQPSRLQEQPPAQPPRPTIANTNPSESSVTSTTAATRKQRKETYEIKKITWHDVTTENNPRVSPILIQNANGPCPLLALVNALTLSTPADAETALVDTLRSREQVSLGLLLDAVFDELMSGRRGDAAQALPDVSDLYAFLITLHTGMNVNPRFVAPPPTKSGNDPRDSMSHVHPSEREAAIPGTFEDTREMKLYSTFSVPLIHGWLPVSGSQEYAALNRSAKSYEDAQNLMFHEEGLEDKLQREGLSFEEQATLEDIATIKAFFVSNATQLTPHGLETITTSLAPGAVAILFRNDHFSTLYRHPDTLQLLQLVTDMGYAGHEEVVWESLIDVTGENAEFFSGDFRLVGGAPATQAASNTPGDGWTTANGRRNDFNQEQSHRATPSSSSNVVDHAPAPPQSPNTEQEDHDLALALQLQEEEEERHRTELARRRRETELSQQYIEQQGQNNNIPVSTRGGGRVQGRGRGTRGNSSSNNPPQEARPAIPPRRNNAGGQAIDPEAGVDAPPPSYEQAANQAAYVPPTNHPSHPSANPIGTGRRMSAYSANASAHQGSQQQAPGRVSRRGTGPTLIDQMPGRRNTSQSLQGGQGERERDCVVM
jgi:hypothetical protein